MKKIRRTNGESLVECLMAILVVVLAVSVLGGYMLTSERLVSEAKRQREHGYGEISFLEALESREISEEITRESGEALLTISIKRQDGSDRTVEKIPVIYYYGEHIAAYEVADE